MLLAVINNNIYWIFLKNSEYTYKRIMNNFVGLDTPNSKIMPYVLNIAYNMNSERNSSSHNTNNHTTDDELSITEHCHK